jgi:hypothetical protein
MLSTLEYVNERVPAHLAKAFFKHCDKIMILFVTEIVINLLEGAIPVKSNRPFLKYQSLLEKLYVYGGGGGGRMDISAKLSERRAVLSAPKGLKLVKLLVKTLKRM